MYVNTYVQAESNTMKMLFFIMSNLQTYYHFKLYFQKLDQNTEGKWFIHGIKHRKEQRLLECYGIVKWTMQINFKEIWGKLWKFSFSELTGKCHLKNGYQFKLKYVKHAHSAV